MMCKSSYYPISSQKTVQKHKIRQINNQTIVNMQSLLGETWESIYNASNVNTMSKNFQCTFLRGYDDVQA